MNRISLDVLWPKKRIDILRYTPQVLIVIFLCAAADGVLWYFCFNAPTQYRSAFISAASAWGLAVMAYVAKWLQAVTDQVKRARESRRVAYAKFLSASDSLVEANARLTDRKAAYDTARDELDAAKRQYDLSPTDQNKRTKITADVKLGKLSEALENASDYANDLPQTCEAASNDVDQLASRSVRPAFEAFRLCPPQHTSDRADARSRFVMAARDDLKLPRRADESNL